MARGTSLSQLRRMVRAEIGQTPKLESAKQSDPLIDTLLANKQIWLETEYDWPFLSTYWEMTAQGGREFFTVPSVDYKGIPCQINFERDLMAERKFNNYYAELDYGIGTKEWNALRGVSRDPIQRWQLADSLVIPTPMVPEAVAGAAGVLTGYYQYFVTFLTDAEESPISPAVGVELTGQQATVSFTTSLLPEVTGRRIWRTSANGEASLLLTDVMDNTTTSITDNAPDSSLGRAYEPTVLAQKPRFVVWPKPITDQPIRFTGTRHIVPLVQDTDLCDMDDMLLVLMVAGELLMKNGAPDANLKLSMARDRLTRLRAFAQSRQDQPLVIGSGYQNRFNKRQTKVVPIAIA